MFFILKDIKKKILKLDGWGELSFNNLIKSINISKKIELDKFIFSLGIRYVGETLSSVIAKEFITKVKAKVFSAGSGPVQCNFWCNVYW